MERGVDLQLARVDLEMFAKKLGLTQATRYINAFALAPVRDFEKTVPSGESPGALDRANRYGLQISFDIPIYDFGEARTRDAQETYIQSANLLAEKAVNVRSEVREAFIAYKGAFEVARLYQAQVEPLQSEILKQSLLQTNTMQTDVFVLVQDARNRILAYVAALNARRDFWIADTDLGAAIIGGGIAGRTGDARAAVSALADRNAGETYAFETRISSCNGDIGCDGHGRKRTGSGRRYSRSSGDEGRCNATAVHSPGGCGLQPRGHLERLDASLADEPRPERVPLGCRACRSRVCARNESASLGLQRPVTWPHDRGRRGGQGQDLCDEQAA
jgi:Outer membrane efflux protein